MFCHFLAASVTRGAHEARRGLELDFAADGAFCRPVRVGLVFYGVQKSQRKLITVLHFGTAERRIDVSKRVSQVVDVLSD